MEWNCNKIKWANKAQVFPNKQAVQGEMDEPPESYTEQVLFSYHIIEIPGAMKRIFN
jgi:hypothetical protein